MLDQLPYRCRYPLRETLPQPLLGELTQMCRRRDASGHQLLRILVAQAVQTELAARRDGQSFCN